jgi:hypothetical protein
MEISDFKIQTILQILYSHRNNLCSLRVLPRFPKKKKKGFAQICLVFTRAVLVHLITSVLEITNTAMYLVALSS